VPDIEIELEDGEDIVRVYTRIPDQPWLFRKLVAADFARIMHAHSGISLLRRMRPTCDGAKRLAKNGLLYAFAERWIEPNQISAEAEGRIHFDW
jgi:hypothetical protein